MPIYKPEGYNTVSPYFIVSDAAATIAFLEKVFFAQVLRKFPDDDGKLMHAEIRIDDTVVMLADSAPDWPPVASYAHVYVANVDATYRRALDAGAQSVQIPEQKGDEDKRGGVKDPGGTIWWIATRLG
jgi:PhnB protein